jgi:hypothetical protein
MKNLLCLVIGCVAFTQAIQAAPPVKHQMTEAESHELLQFIGNLNHNEAAFRPVALHRMLLEVNLWVERLKLPGSHPVQLSDVKGFHVSPPYYCRILNTNYDSPLQQLQFGKISVGGNVQTTNFFFGFADGRLWSVVNNDINIERFRFFPIWAEMPSLVNSNGAYQLATQWLAAVDVNVTALERKYGSQKKIEQAFFWNQPGLGVEHPLGDTNKTMLPIFIVTWGGNEKTYISPVARVEVFGATKELMKLEVGDGSLWRRPALIVSSVADFNKFIKAQTNLPVLHFQHFKNSPPAMDFTNTPPPFHQKIESQ